jgi:hypothetical protein
MRMIALNCALDSETSSSYMVNACVKNSYLCMSKRFSLRKKKKKIRNCLKFAERRRLCGLEEHAQGLFGELDLRNLCNCFVRKLEQFLSNLVPVFVVKRHRTACALFLYFIDETQRAENEGGHCVTNASGSTLREGFSCCEVNLCRFNENNIPSSLTSPLPT